MAPSPTQLTDPIVPNLGFTATPTTSPPPQHSRLLPSNDQRQTPLRLSLPPRPCCIPTLSPLHATSHTRTAATLQHLGPHPSCINSSCMYSYLLLVTNILLFYATTMKVF